MHHRFWSRLSVRLPAGLSILFGILAIAVGVAIFAVFTTYSALRQAGTLTEAEREAAAIGVAAREQYIHEAHGIITRDPIHLGHDREWASELERRVTRLRPMMGDDARGLLDTVQSKSASLHKAFAEEIFPAVEAADVPRVRLGHDRAQELLDAMVEASDRAAASLVQRTVSSSSAALRRARIAGIVAVGTTLVAAAAAVILALVFVRGIVRPLSELNAAAVRIGKGDLNAVAPPMGAAEFEELRAGLEQMAAGLREREARLLKSERLAGLGALSAGVAHELNNPLGVIIGYVKTLRKTPLDAETADELRIVEEEAHQCRRIVEDLVAFAREPRLERKRVDVTAVVRDVVDRLAHAGEIPTSSVEVASPSPVHATIDGTRIAQVVRNLLLNAVAASPPEAKVIIDVRQENGAAVVRMKDRGAGIAPEDLPHLFEPFFSRRSGGSGLGLAVSHGIVTAHGGTIDVQSVLGKGTIVTVSFPTPKERVSEEAS